MVRNRHLAKSILDASWGYLIRHLTSKAVEADRVVVLVDPGYTSKICSRCGHTFESLSLSDHWIACGCGLSLDRDHNAAISILNRLDTSVGQKLASGRVAPSSRAVLTAAEGRMEAP